jgi:predicted RNase H-like HicB family nuclease
MGFSPLQNARRKTYHGFCLDSQETDLMIIEVEREEDGRWIAEAPELPGVMSYGQTRDEALLKVKAPALRTLADRLEHGERVPELSDVFAVQA